MRGDHRVATTTINDIDLIAVGWKDKTLKQLVSTCGTTLEGPPATRTRYRTVVGPDGVASEPYKRETKRCQLVADYFDNMNKLDVHNHYRQGSLALEVCWLTKKWTHRVLASCLAIDATDAYLAYSYEHEGPDQKPFLDFIDVLAFQLINSDVRPIVVVLPFIDLSRRQSSCEHAQVRPPNLKKKQIPTACFRSRTGSSMQQQIGPA